MLKTLLSPPRRMPRDISEELLSICRSQQLSRLEAARQSGGDTGAGCGCEISEFQEPRTGKH